MTNGLERDLRRIVEGEVLCDDVSRSLYSVAACIFQMVPSAVVAPRHREDVSRVVRYAAEHGIPVTARGTGSGLAGQTLGEGIVIDFSRHMNRIVELRQGQFTVRVQPGVVLGDLNRYLRQFGLWFPPDPSSGEFATLGGMIGNNASGAHTVKYGATRDYVLGLDCVLDDGSFNGEARWKDIAGRLSRRFADERAVIDRGRPDVLKNSSGYHVFDRELDMNRLVVGSEGTLALATEATLKVVRKLPERALVRASFDDLEAMGRAVQVLRPLGPSAIEVIDKTMIDLVRGSIMEFRQSFPDHVRAIVLCEFDGDLRDEVARKVEEARAVLTMAVEVTTAVGAEMEALWKIRRAASPILDRMPGRLRSTRIIEDGAVHPDRFVEYIQGIKKLFRKHDVEGIVFGHAGSGQVHVNLLLDPRSEEHYAKLRPIAEDASDLVASLKGTLSGEHGDGILRAAYLRKTFGDLYPLFEEVKRTFDPKSVLNPGKKLAPADFDFTRFLRSWRRPGSPYRKESPFYPWRTEIERCNGCGECRTYCPVYLEVRSEIAAPRAKASAFVAALEGRIPEDPAALRTVADYCINCKLCLVLCPSRVDIPGMCLEAKAFDVARRGLSRRDALFAAARENSQRAARWVPLSNWALPLGKLVGIARAPRFVRADVRPSKKSDKKVIYFAGCFADFNDPLGEKQATIRVLERNGFEVIIPEYRCCGLSALSQGARMQAIELAQYNVNLLSKWDLPIVTSAPSCGFMLKAEVPRLLEYEAARKVADRVVDVHEFLWRLHEKGEFDTKFKRIASTLMFHPTCHLRAMGADGAARRVLGLIPDISLVEIPERCCGMAGAFGMKSESVALSREIGGHVFADIRAKNPTLLASSNGTCRVQLEEGTGREVLHTMTLLDRAYGGSPLVGFHKVHEGAAMESLKGYMDKSVPDE